MDLTVIIPCYNGSATLHRCIESVLHQERKPQKILIVNDGSTDDSLSIAKQYKGEYEHVDVISHKNRGLPQSRKAGLDEVQTPYVAFLDCDDYVEPDMYRTLLDAIQQTDADMAACGLFYDYPNSSKIPPQKSPDTPFISGREAMRYLHMRKDIFPFMWSKLFRTEMLRQVTFPTGNFVGEDYATLIQYLSRTKRVAVVKKPLYHYILHAGSMSKSGFGPSSIKAYETYREIFSRYSDSPVISGGYNEMIHYYCIEYAAILVVMTRNDQYDPNIIREVASFCRKALWGFLKASYNAPSMKLSVLLISIYPSLFFFLYKCIARFRM